jgi:hypothetical protein
MQLSLQMIIDMRQIQVSPHCLRQAQRGMMTAAAVVGQSCWAYVSPCAPQCRTKARAADVHVAGVVLLLLLLATRRPWYPVLLRQLAFYSLRLPLLLFIASCLVDAFSRRMSAPFVMLLQAWQCRRTTG